MGNKLIVTAAPHITSADSTQKIMQRVCIALLPALVASVIIFGINALIITVVTVAACVIFEYLYCKLVGREVSIGDFSAVVTGLLLAFNLPSTLPFWMPVVGAFIAIVVVKQLFGGLGRNFANPAIVARIVLFLSFSKTMTAWQFPDAVSSATPLALMANGQMDALPSKLNLFLGMQGGCLGEVSALALLLGFAYLMIRGVITWHTPVVFVGTVFLLSWAIGGSADYALCQVLSGGLLLGAIFMATDYVTTPSTKWGQVIFGLGAGLLTILIRQWGNYAEGVSFAILFMNILTPYISKWTRSKPFGGVAA